MLLGFVDEFQEAVQEGEVPGTAALFELSMLASGVAAEGALTISKRIKLLRSIFSIGSTESDLKTLEKYQRKLSRALEQIQNVRASEKMPGSVTASFEGLHLSHGELCDAAAFWVQSFGESPRSVKWGQFTRAFARYYSKKIPTQAMHQVVGRLKRRVKQDDEVWDDF